MFPLNDSIIINKNLIPVNNDMVLKIQKKKKKPQKIILSLIFIFYDKLEKIKICERVLNSAIYLHVT